MTIIKAREIPGFPRNLITRTGIIYYVPPNAKFTSWRRYIRLTPALYNYRTQVELVTEATPNGVATAKSLSKPLFELLTLVWPDDNPFDTQFKLRMSQQKPKETLFGMRDYMRNPLYAYRCMEDDRLFGSVADIAAYYMLSRNSIYQHVLTIPSYRKPLRGYTLEEVYTYRQPYRGTHDNRMVTYEELFELPGHTYPTAQVKFPPTHVVTEL